MIVVGLNAYHGDASACLLRDGELVAAAEEERFRRIKHWAGFPAEALRYCLAEAGARLADVDHIALNSDPNAAFWRRALYAARHRPDPSLVVDRLRNRRRRASVRAELDMHFPGDRFAGDIHRVEHHLAHLASAFLASPFSSAAAVSVDGFGDFASAAWGVGEADDLRIDGRVFFPHSLGVFYQAITQHLGFPHYGDEYKVMGLAPYGAPTLLDEMRRIVRLEPGGAFALDLSFFRHHREKIAYRWQGGAPSVGTLYASPLAALLGPARAPHEPLTQRHRDIARSAQAMYEEALFHLLNALHDRCGMDALALAGGCAMNSVANGRIRARTPFRSVYVQAAAGDAGGALGAALVVWRRQGGARRFVMDRADWGPSFGAPQIARALEGAAPRLAAGAFTVSTIEDMNELCRRVARAVADGKVVGWFQGRMEWGPRALGQRSIVCDPRRADMKQILNAKIKRRESFRPFAPSILSEFAAEWFEEDGAVPFMTEVHQVRAEKRALIPAVVHVDGSGRLQTVARHANPRYHALISAFRDLTGVPIVLNTSFNESEPIVCAPQEALDCFLRTNMDLLALGDVIVERGGA